MFKALNDHAPRTESNPRAQLTDCHGREVDARQHVIGCAHQIGRCVDQGAVEIEHDGRTLSGLC